MAAIKAFSCLLRRVYNNRHTTTTRFHINISRHHQHITRNSFRHSTIWLCRPSTAASALAVRPVKRRMRRPGNMPKTVTLARTLATLPTDSRVDRVFLRKIRNRPSSALSVSLLCVSKWVLRDRLDLQLFVVFYFWFDYMSACIWQYQPHVLPERCLSLCA